MTQCSAQTDQLSSTLPESFELVALEGMWHDIVYFYSKYGMPLPESPQILSAEMMEFRKKFLHEELAEFESAVASNDLGECLDALVDLVVVAMGTAYLMGLPFMDAWREVQMKNLQKVRVDHAGESKRGSSFDLKKPEGWTAPDQNNLIRHLGMLRLAELVKMKKDVQAGSYIVD